MCDGCLRAFAPIEPRAAERAAPGEHADDAEEKILQAVTGGAVAHLRGTIPAVHPGRGAVFAGRLEHEPPVVVHCIAAPTPSALRRGRYEATGANMFASRANNHLPLCFVKTDSVWPDRVIGEPPPAGVTTTVSFVHMKAQSPSTLIS
jgi:hypothetical protein